MMCNSPKTCFLWWLSKYARVYQGKKILSFQCLNLTEFGEDFELQFELVFVKFKLLSNLYFLLGEKNYQLRLSNMILCLNYRLNLKFSSNPVQVREIFSRIMQQSLFLRKILPMLYSVFNWYGCYWLDDLLGFGYSLINKSCLDDVVFYKILLYKFCPV